MPTVIAFKDGKVVNQFSKHHQSCKLQSHANENVLIIDLLLVVGALPEPHVKKFIESL
jgi:hypothetical protein